MHRGPGKLSGVLLDRHARVHRVPSFTARECASSWGESRGQRAVPMQGMPHRAASMHREGKRADGKGAAASMQLAAHTCQMGTRKELLSVRIHLCVGVRGALCGVEAQVSPGADVVGEVRDEDLLPGQQRGGVALVAALSAATVWLGGGQ